MMSPGLRIVEAGESGSTPDTPTNKPLGSWAGNVGRGDDDDGGDDDGNFDEDAFRTTCW